MRVPPAAYIAIGDELASARRPDTNGEALARWLEALGCELRSRTIVPDSIDSISAALKAALAAGSELVVLSGGLGPTHDDVTRAGIAQALERELVTDEAVLRAIESRFRDRGLEVPP